MVVYGQGPSITRPCRYSGLPILRTILTEPVCTSLDQCSWYPVKPFVLFPPSPSLLVSFLFLPFPRSF